MKRSGSKAIGLGLALLAGRATAADPPRPAGEWQPAGSGNGDLTWTPIRRPAPPVPTPPPAAGVVPSGGTVFTPSAARPADPAPAAPRPPAPAAGSILLPVIPVAVPPSPPGIELPPLPGELRFSPVQSGPRNDAIPSPRPVAQSGPQTPPAKRPGSDDPVAPKPLPAAPRLLPPPASELPPQAELAVAPARVLAPSVQYVPGKHGTFGSPAIQISRDHPKLSELVHGSWWGRQAYTDGVDLAPDAPAEDRASLRLEYLLWFINRQQVPVLATTSTNGGFGFLGDPGTQTLLGPGPVGDTLRSGFRVRAGYWFDGCGVDGSFFFLGRDRTAAAFDSGTFPTVTRPFFAPNFNAEFGEIVALPNFARGNLAVETDSFLYGFDANLRCCLCRTCGTRSELFGGFRFLGLNEGLRITETITSLAGNPNDPPGTRVSVQDEFRTRNGFYGGQVGYAREQNWGRVSVDGRASVALGVTHQELEIRGSQSRLRPGMGTPDTFNGGLLATGPNLGTFAKDKFSVVPELTLNLGYWVTPGVKAYVGYNYLYWSNVIRPGDQIDRTVDVALVPNPPAGVPFSGQFRPRPTFKQSDLNVHGIQFGVEFRW